MWLLLNPRFLIAVAILAALAFTHTMAWRKGASNVKAEWTLSVANANAEARDLERQRQRRADEAGRLAATREAGIRADAVRAAGAARGLRDELAALRGRSQSCPAEAERTAAIGNLLGQCADEYRALAERADRHVNDIRLLLESWPK